MTLAPRARNPGWAVVMAALSINLILGVLYAWGVMGKALVTQWQWSKTQAALPFTVATAAFAVMMIFAGRWQDRIGPRLVAMLGGLTLGAGLIGSSFATTPVSMLLCYGVVGGVGIGLGYSATTPPCVKWFPSSRKGLITGIVVSGVGMAAVYISPLTEFLLKQTTIPRTFVSLGLGAMVLVTLLAQRLANPPDGYVPPGSGRDAPTAATRPAPAPADRDWHEMLQTRQFFQLWLMFVLATSAGLMIIAHVAIIGKEQANLEWGFLPIAMLALFNTCGRVAAGFASDRIGRTNTMLVAFVLQAANMFAFAQYTTPALLVFGSAFTGLCYGTFFTLMPAATADYYGLRHLGVNYGILFTAFGVAGVVGPILGGRIRDLWGSYALSFQVSGVMLLAGAVLALLVRSPSSHRKPRRPGPRESAGREPCSFP